MPRALSPAGQAGLMPLKGLDDWSREVYILEHSSDQRLSDQGLRVTEDLR